MSIRDRQADARPARSTSEHIAELLPGIVHALTNLHTQQEQMRDTIRGDRGVLLTGAVSRPLYNGQSAKVSSSPGRMLGYSIRETTGAAAAVVRFHDGQDSGGDLLDSVAIGAGLSVAPWFGPNGKAFGAGLYVEIVSGTVELTTYLGNPR